MNIPNDKVVMDLHFQDKKFIDNVSGNEWTVSETVRFDDGKFGGSAPIFDYPKSGAFLNKIIELSDTEDWTISLWNKRLKPPSTAYEILFNYSIPAQAILTWVCLSDNRVPYRSPSLSTSGGQILSYYSDQILRLEEWEHYAFVHTAADNKVRVFKNGDLTQEGIKDSGPYKWDMKIKFIRLHTEDFSAGSYGEEAKFGMIDDVVVLKGIALWDKEFRGRVPRGPLLQSLHKSYMLAITPDDTAYGIKK